ncbi:MAG: HAD family phosphatase, partial [Oscillospiraceae bacterium]|nr:HAD family phosphatase [Oscillospiraceae bacterium]
EVARKKGFPDVYLLAAERCGAKPEECAVFEDIYLGCVGAKAGNMYTIGILEEHSKPDWEKIKETADETWADYRHLL